MTTNHLTDLMEPTDAKQHSPFTMLVPNGKPLPKRICKQCVHYREGGECPHALHGVTSPLQDADDKRCFTPLDGSAKVAAPEVNDTPVLRERKLKRSERYQSKAAREKREAKFPADPTPTTRICQRCGRELPMEKFRKQHGDYDRIHTCNECIAEARFGKRDPKPVEIHPRSDKRVVAPHPHKYATEAERLEASRRVKREYFRRRRAKLKEKRIAEDAATAEAGTRVCKVCGRELPLSEFAKTKGGGRRFTCRDCQHESFVAAGFKSHQKGAVSVKEVAKVEQVQRTIDKARDKALALGLEKVAQCLAEAAQAMEGVAKELMK